VACPGNDQIIEHGPSGAVARRITVVGGPSALAIDGDRAFVWSQRARLFSSVDLRSDVVSSRPANGSTTTSALVRRGAQLFAATDDKTISSDGRGCASCHPDGRTDGLTWSTPEGPRQTAMLAGRLEGTAPYGWSRKSTTVKEYIRSTIHRLGGRHGDDADLDALVAYVMSLGPPRQATPTSGRGKRIFESADTGCASCHRGPLLTDGKTHDVHSAVSADRESSFDTPSLRFIGKSAPYFHDGRYATLHDLLTDPQSQMGGTSHLAATDVAALEEYLQSL
jgi:cytochrome c peroxidase